MRMRTIVAAALLLTPLALQAQQGDTWNWAGTVGNGRTIEIKGVNGSIRAVLASGSEVRVTAVKREGRRGGMEDVTIERIEHEGGVTICAVYPTPSRSRGPNECRPGDAGRMNVQNNDVRVEFEVQVPAGTNLTARTVNDGIRISGLRSDVRAHTVNGDVRVETSGLAEASTVNGDIDVSMGRTDWRDDLAFETVNGGIVVEFGGELNAQVHASTVNGSIETDWPLTVRGRWGPRRVSGTIGSGGRTLDLTTVNGSIELRKR